MSWNLILSDCVFRIVVGTNGVRSKSLREGSKINIECMELDRYCAFMEEQNDSDR